MRSRSTAVPATSSSLLFTTALLAALTLPLVGAADARAGQCGDDVDGGRIACACGDTVVSDTVLQPSDPVAAERCEFDGLMLRAARGADSIVLDMAGLSISGSGSGVGVRVVDGGAVGALIIGGEPARPGEIANFRNGVRATGSRSLAGIRDLVIKGSSVDGLVIRGSDAEVVRVVAEDSGRDGLRVGGSDHTLEAVEATGNKRYGVRVTGRGVAGSATAAGNAGGALVAAPSGNSVKVEDAD